ncbi:hypothetical protein [Flavobacterium sedimenticola]|uniref:Uncharacterized protein n=1 Tax=Flavobacterium sedimenticola TaxID=3043286 RepID=A0ABT6XSW1_9FLAO|nr:hypothetical protein [Flavobacterium sedimenticola]MDI9258191.1 hypothetical protein [Flavobacterium sedimenticola]
MRTRLLIFYLLTNCLIGYCQEKKSISVKKPLSTTAFDSLIIGELNFMVLGDDNVKQGISYEYKEDNTELNASGKLYSKNSFIMTLDGKFSVNSGAFIFDESDGSKKGKLTTNFFFSLGGNSKFFSVEHLDIPNDIDTQRALIQNKIQSRALADSVYYGIMEAEIIMELFDLPHVSIDKDSFRKQKDLLNKIAEIKTYEFNTTAFTTKNKDRLLKKLRKYYKMKPEIVDYDALVNILNKENKVKYDLIIEKNHVEKIIKTCDIPENFKIEKLLTDYEVAYSKLENYESENNKLEIATFKKYWTASQTNYFGVSPFYERQSFDIYNQNAENTISFKNRFQEIRSDLFGINIGWNYLFLWKNKSFVLIRPSIGLGRSNNFVEYDKNDYSFTYSSENVNGVPIEVNKTRTGYINKNNRNYEYGTFTNFNLELYYAPINIAGLFTKIGYSKNDALLNKEAYPLESGILINLKSKDKKNIVAIQLFMSRLNLNEHPDDDMNFGLKIGLPINISKN